MSRNFELLQKSEMEREIREHEFHPPRDFTSNRVSEPVAGRADDKRPKLAMDEPARAEINKLVQRIFLQPGASRVVVFSAVESSDGCSWITARAAETLAAQVPDSVCVVDANFHSPALHQYFGVENHQGLRHALRHREQTKPFAQCLGGNLWVMTSGSPEADGEATVSSCRQRFGEICREFDYVLFDAPPLTLCDDAIAIATAAADGIALVLEANSTSRSAAMKVVQDIEKARTRLLGAVLNKRTFAIPDQIYRRLPFRSS